MEDLDVGWLDVIESVEDAVAAKQVEAILCNSCFDESTPHHARLVCEIHRSRSVMEKRRSNRRPHWFAANSAQSCNWCAALQLLEARDAYRGEFSLSSKN